MLNMPYFFIFWAISTGCEIVPESLQQESRVSSIIYYLGNIRRHDKDSTFLCKYCNKVKLISDNVERKSSSIVEQVTGSIVEQVTGSIVEQVTGSIVEQVTGSIVEQVTGSIVEQVAGSIVEQVTGSIVEQVTGSIVEQVTGSIVEQVTGSIVEQVTGSEYRKQRQINCSTNNSAGMALKSDASPTVIKTIHHITSATKDWNAIERSSNTTPHNFLYRASDKLNLKPVWLANNRKPSIDKSRDIVFVNKSISNLRQQPAEIEQQNVRTSTSRHRRAVRDGTLDVIVCVLTPYDPRWLFSVQRVHDALRLAVQRVSGKNDIWYSSMKPSAPLLTKAALSIRLRDSKCSIEIGIKEAFEAYIDDEVNVFLGPICDYSAAPVGRQVKYWNIPMVSAGALSSGFRDKGPGGMYPLLTRVGPTLNSLADFLLQTMSEFKWYRVVLVYDTQAQSNIVENFCHFVTSGIEDGLKLVE